MGAVIDLHLENCPEFSETVELLIKSFYVDNCVTSLNGNKDLMQFIKISTKLLADAQFVLRGWEYTAMDIADASQNISSVLGLRWSKVNDVLFCDGGSQMKYDKVTRRKVLSGAHRIFDPIGFISPFTLLPKIMVQSSWNAKKSLLHGPLKFLN